MGFEHRRTVLIVDAHGAGSHVRTNSLLERFSRHDLRVIQPEPLHWRQQALTAHYRLAAELASIEAEWTPDVIIFSGTFNIAALLEMAPSRFRSARRVAYFHESQWIYPSHSGDSRPFIVQHLDAVLVADEAWFNSRYHLLVFQTSVKDLSSDAVPDATIKSVLQRLQTSARVVYPPVNLNSLPAPTTNTTPQRLIWNARWDYDKRPDRLIMMLKDIAISGFNPEILILGTGGTNPDAVSADIGQNAYIPGHLDSREDYELHLAGGGVIVSTADHEFFGVGVLEAVLAGAVPVLPDDLAYPETLPSAWFYRAGDPADLVRVCLAALISDGATRTFHRSDAQRFLAESVVPIWDDLLDQIARP